jgi:hypothetical protein
MHSKDMTNACHELLLSQDLTPYPTDFLQVLLHSLTDNLADLAPTLYDPLVKHLIETLPGTTKLKLSLCNLVLKASLIEPGLGGYLERIQGGDTTGDHLREVAETQGLYTHIIAEMSKSKDKWEDLITEELNKPSLQL